MEWDDLLKQLAVRAPTKLLEETTICPICGKRTLRLSVYRYEVPYFGGILLSSGQCSNCGYKYRDIRLAEARAPRKIEVHVRGERQLRYLLVKAASSSIYIPERRYEMIPGPASTGFITTVEGILHRFQDVLEGLCKSSSDRNPCERERKWLKRAIEGLERFTLVLCDYEGGSTVKGDPDSVVFLPLDRECIEKKPTWLDLLDVVVSP
jgi:zinc finger protein